jgi:hypothetical protein
MNKLPVKRDPSAQSSRRGPSRVPDFDPLISHLQIRYRGKGHLSDRSHKWSAKLPGHNPLDQTVWLLLLLGFLTLAGYLVWTFLLRSA